MLPIQKSTGKSTANTEYRYLNLWSLEYVETLCFIINLVELYHLSVSFFLTDVGPSLP